MPTEADARAAAERVRQRLATEAAARPVDPAILAAQRQLGTIRSHPGWAFFAQTLTAEGIRTRQAYEALGRAIIEGAFYGEALQQKLIEAAHLRERERTLAQVLALVPKDEAEEAPNAAGS